MILIHCYNSEEMLLCGSLEMCSTNYKFRIDTFISKTSAYRRARDMMHTYVNTHTHTPTQLRSYVLCFYQDCSSRYYSCMPTESRFSQHFRRNIISILWIFPSTRIHRYIHTQTVREIQTYLHFFYDTHYTQLIYSKFAWNTHIWF